MRAWKGEHMNDRAVYRETLNRILLTAGHLPTPFPPASELNDRLSRRTCLEACVAHRAQRSQRYFRGKRASLFSWAARGGTS